MFDFVIVGAGLSGATLAERLASYGKKVLIIDKRYHVGGNTWDEYNDYGILEQKYGPHIFHTNNKDVWDYLSKFTHWRSYYHFVLAQIEGKLIPLPFNINSVEELFPSSLAECLISKLVSSYGFGKRLTIQKLRENIDPDIRFLSDYIYRNVFESYTKKQWGMRPEDLLSSVTARVPILLSRDNRYFHDVYQAIPSKGYSSMVGNMLDHPNIHILLNTCWQDIKDEMKNTRLVFTGQIDEFFNYKLGELPYRSLFFDVKTLPISRYQDAAVINYPNKYDYTRISEHKWFTGQSSSHTTISIEYPQQHLAGKTIPYYPIPTYENQKHFRQYKIEADNLKDKTIFAGRLANYTYYDMDQAVAKALMIARSLINE